MKKKIINGILMVALLFAATTSFVSCKDNIDDELLPVYAQLAKQKTDLEGRIATLEGQLGTMQAAIAENAADIDGLDTRVDLLEASLGEALKSLELINDLMTQMAPEFDKIQKDIASLDERVTGLEGDMAALREDLQGQIDELKGMIDGLITDVDINYTTNEFYGTFCVPGINAMALAPMYGSNETGIAKFPYAGINPLVDIVDGLALDAADVAPAKGKEWSLKPEGLITEKSGNAGIMYFTVNSIDPDKFNIDDYTVSVQNSWGMTAPITFSDVKKSAYLLQWGIYHSSNVVDTDPADNNDPTFFQARGHIDEADLQFSNFNIKKFIDYKELKEQFKAAVNDVKAASGKKAKAKSIMLSAAQIVENILSGNLSGDNKDTKNPTWACQKLVLTNNVTGKKAMSSEYNLAVSAITPLSYHSFWELEENARVPSMDRIEQAIQSVANAIKAQLPNISLGTLQITIPTMQPDAANPYILVGPSGAVTNEVTLQAAVFDVIKTALDNGLSNIDLSKAINGLDQVNNLGGIVDNFAARANSALEKIANTIVTQLNNHQLTRAISPIILFNTTEGVQRLVSGATVKAGTMNIMMTSPTEELIVPAYAKYIAVFDASGKAIQADVLNGRIQRWDLDLSKPGTYTIVLSAMDFYGYVINKKYTVNVI